MSEHAHAEDHGPKHYIKIWGILVVLLVVSVLGPMLEIQAITLLTAFGIAFVKAYMVAKNFMHLNVEKPYIVYMLVTAVVFMLLLVAGVAPDVMNHRGHQWVNVAAEAQTGAAAAAAGPAEEAPFDAAEKYGAMCSSCHGPAGAGDGAAAAALTPKPANFTDPSFWASRDRESIINVIRDGGAAVGKSPLMGAYGSQFDAEQLGQMADFVMAFNPAAEPAEAPAP